MSNPVGFNESYPDRTVNSIYYDDIDFSAYNDNLLGISNRVKYRVRWYGPSLTRIANPILEKKIKINQLGTKEFLKLDDFDLEEGLPDINTVKHTRPLFPYLIVRYDRTYMESADGLIRATVDRHLQYINLINNSLSDQIYDDDHFILEIKYDKGHEDIASLCLQSVPFRLTKNSKYVSGMLHYLA